MESFLIEELAEELSVHVEFSDHEDSGVVSLENKERAVLDPNKSPITMSKNFILITIPLHCPKFTPILQIESMLLDHSIKI